MNKMSMSFASFLTLAALAIPEAQAADEMAVTAQIPATSSAFTEAQREEIKKIINDYLTQNPEVVVTALHAHAEKEQAEATQKMEKAVAEHKDKIFKASKRPVAGNPKGKRSLVVFLDPFCGYCKKFENGLPTFLGRNKDVKVIFVDLPVMGERSLVAIKAMLAAHKQGKYPEMQKLIFGSSGKLNAKKIMKKAKSLGLDTEKFEADMKSKELQAEVDANLELAETLGINSTPTLIVNETKVASGYLSPEELGELFNGPNPKATQ